MKFAELVDRYPETLRYFRTNCFAYWSMPERDYDGRCNHDANNNGCAAPIGTLCPVCGDSSIAPGVEDMEIGSILSGATLKTEKIGDTYSLKVSELSLEKFTALVKFLELEGLRDMMVPDCTHVFKELTADDLR